MKSTKERIVPPYFLNQVTAEIINKTLLAIASNIMYPSIASKSSTEFDTIGGLGRIYRQLQARQAKWLTRLILGNLGCVTFPDELDCGPNQQSLPRCVLIKAKFQASIPESERRDGPGMMRLGAAREAYKNLPPTPPTTAPGPASYARPAAYTSHSLRDAIAPSKGCRCIMPNEKSRGELDSRPTRPVSFQGCPTPRECAPVPACSTDTTSPTRRQQVIASVPARVIPFDEYLIQSSRPEGTSTNAILAVDHSQAVASSTPKGILPLSDRRDLLNNQFSSRRKSPGKQFLSRGTNVIAPIQRSAGTENVTSTKQLHSSLENPNTGSPRGGSVQSFSVPALLVGGSGRCRLTETSCPLEGCIFVLAPCIAKCPWITDNLLRWHGSRYVSSVRIFSHPNFPQRCPDTGKLYRKLILVEPQKEEQTVTFLKKVERVLRHKTKDQDSRLEVFDWRILESIAKVDRGKVLEEKCWSKYRMCEV